MRLASSASLYWSIRGEVACPKHVPDSDDPRWVAEGWAPIPISSVHLKGLRYQCQHCAVDGRALIHLHVGPRHWRSTPDLLASARS